MVINIEALVTTPRPSTQQKHLTALADPDVFRVLLAQALTPDGQLNGVASPITTNQATDVSAPQPAVACQTPLPTPPADAARGGLDATPGPESHRADGKPQTARRPEEAAPPAGDGVGVSSVELIAGAMGAELTAIAPPTALGPAAPAVVAISGNQSDLLVAAVASSPHPTIAITTPQSPAPAMTGQGQPVAQSPADHTVEPAANRPTAPLAGLPIADRMAALPRADAPAITNDLSVETAPTRPISEKPPTAPVGEIAGDKVALAPQATTPSKMAIPIEPVTTRTTGQWSSAALDGATTRQPSAGADTIGQRPNAASNTTPPQPPPMTEVDARQPAVAPGRQTPEVAPTPHPSIAEVSAERPAQPFEDAATALERPSGEVPSPADTASMRASFEAIVRHDNADASPNPTTRGEFRTSVAEQVAPHIGHLSKAGENGLRVQLDPPSLGHIDIKVVVNEGELTVEMLTQSHHVKHAVEACLPQLRTSLEEHGIRADSFTVGVWQQSHAADPESRRDGHSPQWQQQRVVAPPADDEVGGADGVWGVMPMYGHYPGNLIDYLA